MNDCQLITDLKKQENTAYELIYAGYFPMVKRYVQQNSGTDDDARDVFQETMLALMDNLPKENFQLTSSLKTYLFAIASNIWLKKLRAVRKMADTLDTDVPDTSLTSFEQQEAASEQTGLLQQIFNSVTSHCQLLLIKTFLEETRRDQLIEELGYKNTHSFDNQKYKCLLQARKYGTRLKQAGDQNNGSGIHRRIIHP
jgi:RNA polymerase sigma factor (sigma-70 family)